MPYGPDQQLLGYTPSRARKRTAGSDAHSGSSTAAKQKQWVEWCKQRQFADGDIVTETKVCLWLQQDLFLRNVHSQNGLSRANPNKRRRTEDSEERRSSDEDEYEEKEDGDSPSDARPDGLLRNSAIEKYIAAISELYDTQTRTGLNWNPPFRGVALKTLLEAREKEENQTIHIRDTEDEDDDEDDLNRVLDRNRANANGSSQANAPLTTRFILEQFQAQERLIKSQARQIMSLHAAVNTLKGSVDALAARELTFTIRPTQAQVNRPPPPPISDLTPARRGRGRPRSSVAHNPTPHLPGPHRDDSPYSQEGEFQTSGDGSQAPSYDLYQARNVADVWQEWEEGINGGPAVKELERVWGPRWRPEGSQRTAWCRRKVIIDKLEDMIRNGSSTQDAIDDLEGLRTGSGVYSLSKLLTVKRK